MSLFESCYRKDMKYEWQLDDQLCGNLCRCTGYRPIRDAGKEVAGTQPQDQFQARLSKPIPPMAALAYENEAEGFWRPDSFESLFEIFKAHPQAKLIAGATDLALDVTKFNRALPELISLEALPSLKKLTCDASGWHIGAGVSLSQLETAVIGRLPALENMLRYFASRQIKNRATVGGNLVNASPIGDLAPVFLSLDATFTLRGPQGAREVHSHEFFLDYRKTAMAPFEVMETLFIPAIPKHAYANSYKVSKRKEMDISAVAAGFYIERDSEGKVSKACFGFGGMAATPKRAFHAEEALLGKRLSSASLRKAMDALAQDFQPLDDHRGTAWYRAQVSRNLLLGFCEEAMKHPFAQTIEPGAFAQPQVRS
jgi:xanthine dehydrogenase small subunit